MNISLAVELDKCSVPYSSSEKTFKLKESNIEITDESVIETCSSDTHECGMAWGRDSHTILRDVPLEACGLLIPHFKDDCVDIKLVQYPPSLRGGYSSASIYGAIKDPISKRIYIVPLVNLGKSNDALNYFDELIANLSLHGSGQSETSANEQATHKEVVAHKKTTAKRFGSTIQPSFDCKNANKLSEKKICANEQLAVLDVEMSKNYKKFASLINKQSLARKLKRAQIYWLKIRNNCSDNLGCLKNKINNRNNDLKFMAYELDTKKGVIAGIKALSLKCDAPFNKMIDEAKITGQGLARVRHKGGICKKSLIEKLINIFLPHNTLGVEDYGVSACHEVPCLEHIMGFVSSGKVVEYFIGCELQETCGSMHMELAEDWGISQTQIILEKTLDVLEED